MSHTLSNVMMKPILVLVLLQVTFTKLQLVEAADRHPTRHHHSDRKNKVSQGPKIYSTFSSISTKLTFETVSKVDGKRVFVSAPSVSESDSGTRGTIVLSDPLKNSSQATKTAEEKVSDIQSLHYDSELDSKFEHIGTRISEPYQSKEQYFVINVTNPQVTHSNKTNLKKRVHISSYLENSTQNISKNRKTEILKNQYFQPDQTHKKVGRRKTAQIRYHSMFETPHAHFHQLEPAFRDGSDEEDSMFTRHNITVETINHESSDKRENSTRKTVNLNDSELEWGISVPEAANKQILNNTSTRILAAVGGDALLPCRVGHLGDRQVSWIRRRDWFVLTSGDAMYAHNDRFVVLHEAGSQDWTLHIKRAAKGDAGMYECQVSTGTGIISFLVKLDVVTPMAHIPGNGRSHVYRGSPFTVYCYIVKNPSPIQNVLWYHNGQALNYQRERDDFQITTRMQQKPVEKGGSKSVRNGVSGRRRKGDIYDDVEFDNIETSTIVSRLRVDFAKEKHSGNYTCTAPNIQPDSAVIYVTEGDKTAAVQRIDSAGNTFSSLSTIVNNFFLVNFLCHILTNYS